MTIKMTPIKKVPGLYWYKDKSNQKKYAYRHRYYDNDGKRKEISKSGFTSERDAHRSLLEIQVKTEDQKHTELESRNLKVSQWLDTWFKANQQQWKQGTIQTRYNAVYVHLIPSIGNKKLQTLTKAVYQNEFINVKLQILAPSTVKAIHDVFKIAINAAVENEILARNRFTKIKIVEPQKRENKAFQANELRAIMDDIETKEKDTPQTLVKLLMVTGMRIGEALGLRWSDIDRERKTITIQRTRKGTNRFVTNAVQTPKTQNSYRTIDVDDSLIKMLDSYRIKCKARHLYFGSSLKDKDFVLMTMQTTRPYSNTAVSELFSRLSKRVGFKITAHMFRHTVATHLISSGHSISSVAALLGDTQQTVLKYYSHVIEAEKKELSVAMTNLIKTM